MMLRPDAAGAGLDRADPDRWAHALQTPVVRDLLGFKRRLIGSLLAGSLGLFVVVLLLAGFARPLLAQPVLGALNLGYVLIIGLYVMCWSVGIVYVAIADRVFDRGAAAVAAELDAAGRSA